MPSILLEHRLRIRNAANTADAVIYTSVRGDTLPYVEGPPTCDGQEINPLTGEFRSGSYTGYIVDAITSGTSRALTSQLEDSTFRQQLAGRVAFWEERVNGGSWSVIGAGFLTLIRLVSGIRYEVTVSDATRVEDSALAFSPKQGVLQLSANALASATSISVNALPFAIAKGALLNFLSGKSAVVSAAAASGATSVSVNALASGLSSGDTAPISESFASYFARWPQRGCLFGGLITRDPTDATSNGFLGVPDLKGWIVVPKDSTSLGGEDRASGTTFFYPVTFYAPPDLKPSNNVATYVPGAIATGSLKAAADIINSAAAPLVTQGGMYGYAPGFPSEFKSVWPGLVYQIALASGDFTNASTEFYAPEGDDGFSGPAPYSSKYTNGIIDVNHGHPGPCIQGTAIGVSSTRYRMRGLTCLPTDASPLYWTGHPIDLFKALMDEQGRLYDATACETVRQTIGADRRISVRITEQPNLNAFLKNAVYAPFGIGVRMNSSGLIEPFCMRILSNTAPTTTITAADIQHDAQGSTGIQSWFELDESQAIRQVVFEYQNFYLLQPGEKMRPDGIGIQTIRIERQNGDPGAVGHAVVSFSVPGMIHSKDSPLLNAPVDPAGTSDVIVQSWVNQLVYEILERWGRGGLAFELPFIRGGAGDTLKLGDELLNQIPQLPTKNKRYGDDNTVGARAMQIVRRTPTPRGALVKMLDSGVGITSAATLPTFTLSASSLARLALYFAEVTVTNAATLNASLFGLEVQMAVTTGSTPASTDYTAAAKYTFGQIPTGAFRLPGVRFSGRTVWVRLRSTQYAKRPSSWTTVASIALGALNPVTSLTVTPNGSDGSQATVTWTVGANADLADIDVYVRPSAQAASTAVRVAVLGNGSNRYVLEGLTPNTSYTVGVQARDVHNGDVSAMVEATFTTANVTVTLSAPNYPQGFVGSAGYLSRLDAVYGLSVWGTAFPSSTEFWAALETGVGSGTYGSFVLSQTIPTVQGDWTVFRALAPNDGLRRQIEARHVRDGATSSSFTTPVTVSPWSTPKRLPNFPITRTIPTADDGYYTATADLSGQVFLNGAGTNSTQKVNVGTPTSSASMQRVYRVPFTAMVPSTNGSSYTMQPGQLIAGAGGTEVDFFAAVVMPVGATITQVAFRGYRLNLTDLCQLVLTREVDNGGGGTGTVVTLTHATTGWATVTSGSLSETIAGGTAIYVIELQLKPTSAASNAAFAYTEITVTVPDLNTGL